MESVYLVDSDDREEGEIVDDEFEDISDNSIIVPLYSGKCVSSKEHLYALSLSSVSDLDDERADGRARRCRRKHRRHSSKHSTSTTTSSSANSKKRRVLSHPSASDSDSDCDRTLQKRLKEAVRIEEPDEQQRNSLRARLAAMAKTAESPNEEKAAEKSDEMNEATELDNELILLRMEALRTAVMNKFVHRKKRKLKEENLAGKSKSDTNKENTNNEMNQAGVGDDLKDSEPLVPENVAEEDEDVLRALLLASMSKKITKETTISDSLPIVVENSTKLPVISKTTLIRQQIQLPQVKPLIISINSDSSDDSDENFESSDKKIVPFDLQSTVDRFLKEQRAKAEQAKLLTSTPVSKKTPIVLEKSAVKLLPKVKQIEYQKLLQRIKNAEVRQQRVRRSSKGSDIKLAKLKSTNKLQIASKAEKVAQGQKPETVALNKTLKDIHVNKNGRLQIQETYKILTPLVKKVNAANVERRKYNQRVKQLLEELTEAKRMLTKAHDSFTTSVRELLETKREIDEKDKVNDKEAVLKAPIEENVEREPNELNAVIDKTDFVRQREFVISGDPNDIEVIYNIKPAVIDFPRYVSPLDSMNRMSNDDPLAILCPFDMSGTCRDPECKYKHIVER